VPRLPGLWPHRLPSWVPRWLTSWASTRVAALRLVPHRVATCVEIIALLITVWWVGEHGHAFTGFPKGHDAMGHLSKAQFIASNWPHISWNYEWYSGQPAFAGSYPPGYHLLLVAVSWAAHVSLPTAMNAVTYAAIGLLVIGTYAIARAATRSHLAGLLAAGLLIAAPTMWSQNVVLGLYPRFTALALLAPALATAIVFARDGSRLPALATVTLLALSLSMHPIVGAMGIAMIAAIVVVGPVHSLGARLVSATALVGVALMLAAYFYLPLALQSRSQSLFTNTETPLPFAALGLRPSHSMDSLPVMLLPSAVIIAVFVVVLCKRPRVSYESKLALGADVLLLSAPPLEGALPEMARTDVRRYVRWYRRREAVGFAMRLCLLFVAAVPWFIAYGFIGHIDQSFPYYINGLQPSDLLVYPAFLCCVAVGIAFGMLSNWLRARWRARRPWRLRFCVFAARYAARCALAGVIVVIVAVPMGELLPIIAPSTSVNDTSVQATRLSMYPIVASAQRDYRVAGTGDSLTKWINEYSDAPQDRGYDDHGALHFDWQNWLEQAVASSAFTPEQRDFLLDWYAIKWIDTDSGQGDAAPYADLSRFEVLATATNYADFASFRYLQAKPIMSATNVPTVLVIGDPQHFDLLLRALSYAAVGSDQLIPLQGPTSLDDVRAADLAHVDTVMLYGAAAGDPNRDAKMLSAFVNGGGRLVVDAADDQAAMGALARAKNSPLPVKAARDGQINGPGWAWAPVIDDPLLAHARLTDFGAASYADQNLWSVFGATELQSWAHTDLSTHGRPVLVSGKLGAGQAIWSGIGLPYHVDSFGSVTESSWLANLLGSTPLAVAANSPSYTAQFVDAGHRRVIVSSSGRAVLLKEQDAPDWHATVDGHGVPIYSAGPGMMWIPLPADGVRHVVDVRYEISGTETLGYVVSALTLLVVLALFISRELWRRGEQLIGQVIDGTSPPTVRLANAMPSCFSLLPARTRTGRRSAASCCIKLSRVLVRKSGRCVTCSAAPRSRLRSVLGGRVAREEREHFAVVDAGERPGW